jgi:hypothetical protein
MTRPFEPTDTTLQAFRRATADFAAALGYGLPVSQKIRTAHKRLRTR